MAVKPTTTSQSDRRRAMGITVDRTDSDYLIKLQSILKELPVQQVPADHLQTGFSPRVDGEDTDHIRILAETADQLPPILVHRTSMTVIDGAHRLRVAQLLGENHIAARFFDGDQETARLLAVAANITHGRSLTTTDRATAAMRIFTAHPQWSDRAVAAVAGLSPKKIARLRKEMALPHSDCRVGRDGRVRPVDAATRRERAGQLIRTNPDYSLRQIAAEVGLAPATVADVRNRIQRGDSPIPNGTPHHTTQTPHTPTTPPHTTHATVTRLPPTQHHHTPTHHEPPRITPKDARKISNRLARDPSLRHNTSGRTLLRLLDVCALITHEQHKITQTVPGHCKESVAQLAHEYARMWQHLAEELTRQTHNTHTPNHNNKPLSA
jgi:AraC-like DNA-binding protein